MLGDDKMNWIFVINKGFYSELKEQDEIIWNSHKDVKKGDIILIYTANPYSSIGFILKAITDPFENPEIRKKWKRMAIEVQKISEISEPIEFSELKENHILKELGAVKSGFRGSHFKISDSEFMELLRLIIKKNPELESEIENLLPVIRLLFEEFNEKFLTKLDGIEHNSFYDKERQEVIEYYDKIKNNPEILNDTKDPIINYLLPIKRFAIAPAGFGDIKAVRKTDKNLPEFSKDVYELITDLVESNNKDQQKQLIKSFKTGQYQKGIQTAVLSSPLYYLRDDYWFINSKTVNTFKFLSKIIGENKKINGNLFDYIDNLQELKDLVVKISSQVPKFSDFEVFDAFCHWLNDDKLGYYAIDTKKYKKWLLSLLNLNGKPSNVNISTSLRSILDNYNLAKEKKLSPENQEKFEILLNNSLPNFLQLLSGNEYYIYSSGKRWNNYPFIAIKDDNEINKVTEGVYVNYIFPEDMSGVYLSIRQGVSKIVKENEKNLH